MVALGLGGGRVDERGALDQRRAELAGLAAEEAVEPVEALAGRPVVEGAGRGLLPRRRLVPLAERAGGVAVVGQRLRERARGPGAQAVVPGGVGGELRDVAHPDGVVVAAGHQRGPGRRAHRGGVEPGVAQPAVGERLRGRHRARPAERGRRPEAHVVEQHQQHVGRTRGRGEPLAARPLPLVVADVERLLGHRPVGVLRQVAAVHGGSPQEASVWAAGRPAGSGTGTASSSPRV